MKIVFHLKCVTFSFFWYLNNIAILERYFKYKRISKYQVALFHLWKPSAKYFTGYLKSTNQKVFIKFGTEYFISREIEAIKFLSTNLHSNMWLPTIVDYETDGRYPNIIFNYIEGTPLNKISKSNVTFQLKNNMFNIFNEISNLFYSLGVIHRDIRPHNIIIGKNNEIYLIDFAFLIDTNKRNSKLKELPSTPENIKKLTLLGHGYNPDCGIWDDAYSFHKIMNEFKVEEKKIFKFSKLIGNLSMNM